MSSRTTKRKAVINSEQNAKRARGETDLGYGLQWTAVGEETPGAGLSPLLCLKSDTLEGRQKLAGFDIDFTVIKTASGRKFAIEYLNLVLRPIKVFASTGTNHYRKPYTAMWDYCLKHCNRGVKVDKSKSLYVGDAAGRAKNWAHNKPKDFSCSDRMFAANIGVKFATPEEFFLGEAPAPFEWGSLDPCQFLKNNPAVTKAKDTSCYASKFQEMVLLVGPPASGKSTFRQRYLEPHGYITVNRDTLGTVEKCLKGAGEALKNGKSVVVDNTNPSASARALFLDLAKNKGVPCRCIWLQTTLELAHHLNLFRQSQTHGKVRRVPDVGYNVFKKNFQEPSKSEGFSDVIKVQFKPRFDNSAEEDLFKNWTV
ncbi:polynucleotide kinase 3'-phosphatase [Plakobranchus ocellatus]|uniref:Polynucleotide kinase 3'-phosphatase n=1 Tax=Plakobranchus ocellatus TaxID=259542 RepID=A0AAV4BFP7_9GAST|nr:polynucleotide kinase 3'-phosphatase [Plakobranchus ocellatus]